MDSLKVMNNVISEKIKRNLSMVEFHKKEVERYESIISELDELRDDLEFEFDCEDQTYKYNDQTQRFDKVANTKESNCKFCHPLSLIKDYKSDDDEDDCTPDLFRDEFDDDDVTYSQIDASNYLFEGKTSLKDFYRIIDIEEDDFEESKGEAETLAGFLLEISGNFPNKRQKITFNGIIFTIENIDKRRIKQIKVTLP